MFRLLILCLPLGCALGAKAPSVDWVDRRPDGSYKFAYATGDEGKHYHTAAASAANVVAGKFGSRDPATGGDLQTTYTAGPRGFRARGPHIARIMDLAQNKPPYSRPNNDGKYRPELDNVFDPNEDRSYSFSVKTKDYTKDERADSLGEVQGRYTYLDDIGQRHDVEYIAGSRTGFVVKNSVPDTVAQVQSDPLFYQGNKVDPKARGHHSIQKAPDGSYSFVASGPDQKRSEVSDALGNRRGSYTYLDDKGQQHTVQYIAGPNIGYKVINKDGPIFAPGYPYYPAVSGLTPGGTPIPTLPPTAFPSPTPSFPSGPGFPSTPSSSSTPSLSGPMPGYPDPSPGFPGSTPSFPDLPDISGPPPSPTFGPQSPSGSPDLSSTIPPFPLIPTTPPSLGSNPNYGPSLPDEKWPDISNNDFLTDPLFADFPAINKDWSNKQVPNTKHHKFPVTSTPSFGLGPYFPVTNKHPPPIDNYNPNVDVGHLDHSYADFDLLHHQLFPNDGLKTAESGAGLANNFRKDNRGKSPYGGNRGEDKRRGGGYRKGQDNFLSADRDYDIRDWERPKNHNRGDTKYGGVKKHPSSLNKQYPIIEDSDGYYRLPPGVAVRAHVQSLDIVPYEKRYISPSEALEMHSRSSKQR